MAQDALGLLVASNHEDAEKGLQLAYLMLTEPKIEAAAFENWKQRQHQQITGRSLTPAGIASEAFDAAAYPESEARLRSLTQAQLDNLTIEKSQAWLDAFVASAPIEVTIVGDMPKDRAMQLAAAYFGALPARKKLDNAYLAEKRMIKHSGKPIEIAKDVQTKTDQAVVRVGFYGPDATNIRDSRLMELARQIVSSRMVKYIREEKVLVYSISAGFSAGEAYPGWGTFAAGAPCEPAKSAALALAIREVFDNFAKTGPTEEEMTVAKKQIDSTFSEQMKQSGFWTQRLNGLAYRGRSLDEIAAGADAFKGFTAKEVQEAFVKYDRPEKRFSVRVTPTAAPAGN